MRKKVMVLFLFPLVVSPLNSKELFVILPTKIAQDYLARHGGKLELEVIAEIEEFLITITKGEEQEVAQITNLNVQVFEIPKDKELFYVYTPSRFDRNELSKFGSILMEGKNGLILAIDKGSIIHLNRLPIELWRIPLRPRRVLSEITPPPPIIVSDSLVTTLVAQVNSDSLLNHIRRLQDFYTRYSTTESCHSAVFWMREKLIEYGCDSTVLDTYQLDYAPNIIGVKKGKVNPKKIYVLCAHIDNTSNYAPDHCPGSDDNASGVALLLEAARVFQYVDFAYSVYIIGFTGEEQGLVGSESFCNQALLRGDSIICALNFDMISYGREDLDSLRVIGKISNPNCAWLVDSFIANAQTYTTLKTIPKMVNYAPYSDHHSFWETGYPALCGIENDFTPEYHTIGDTIGPLYYVHCGTNNWFMATETGKAAVATIARLAGALPRIGITQDERVSKYLPWITPTIGRPPFIIQGNISGITIFDPLGRKVTEVTSGNKCLDIKNLNIGNGKAGVYFISDKKGKMSKILVIP